jgi:hypothetical protein
VNIEVPSASVYPSRGFTNGEANVRGQEGTEQAMKAGKMNTLVVGMIEGFVFTVIMIILGNTVFRPYQLIIDRYEIYYVTFQFLAVPFLNLMFRNYRALAGNLIGIPLGYAIPLLIASLFFGHRG